MQEAASLRHEVWNRRLDAKMNVVYIKRVLDRKTKVHLFFAIAIPVLSGGTLAVWLSKAETVLYPIIGVLVALLSAVQSALKLYEAVPKLRQIHEMRLEQEILWDKLWSKFDSISPREAHSEYERLRGLDAKIEKLEGEFAEKTSWISEAQDAVRRAEGLAVAGKDHGSTTPALPPKS